MKLSCQRHDAQSCATSRPAFDWPPRFPNKIRGPHIGAVTRLGAELFNGNTRTGPLMKRSIASQATRGTYLSTATMISRGFSAVETSHTVVREGSSLIWPVYQVLEDAPPPV